MLPMTMFFIFAVVVVLLFLGVSTAVTMGFASIATYRFADGDPARLFLVSQRMFSQVSGITLMSIPFFLLMGNLMSVGGILKAGTLRGGRPSRKRSGLFRPPLS